MVKVLFAASESAPFYKTGGLGDVTYALPQALAKAGVDVRVVVPYYSRRFPAQYAGLVSQAAQFSIQYGHETKYVGVKTMMLNAVQYYFIDNQEFFGRDGLYGYWDDGGRFGYFTMALLEMLQVIDFVPDVLHVNDWHVAMAPVLLRDKYSWMAPLAKIKTQLTIHNLQFQGWFTPAILDNVFGIGRQFFNDDGFAQNGMVNFMKGGLNFADHLSTVSPTYAQEIQRPEFGEGLDGTIRKQAYKLVGILNGIDTTLYNPATDPALPAPFSAQDLTGKGLDKLALQKRVHLPESGDPLFGMVSRLTRQKGADLLLPALEDFLIHQKAQVVVLGTGDAEFEAGLRELHNRMPNQLAVITAFDEALAQLIYAGADFFIMPSAFEPSGLAQMMAMRYGTLPVVHETGGLRDSVQAYNAVDGSGTGFSFWEFTPQVLVSILTLAATVYKDDPTTYQQLQQHAMAKDFDWAIAAEDYIDGYKAMLN